MNQPTKETLWNRPFIFAFSANFLMMFAFYLLMPTLPFYLSDAFEVNKAAIGMIMSVYIVAALAIRPFSGYFIDTLDRKKLYLAAYLIFTILFAWYGLTATLSIFIIIRVLHGFTFGVTTTASSTIAIDVLPASRRGEGIGYYGLSSNIAMAMGPMAGLFLMETFSYGGIFWSAFASGSIGFVAATMIKTPLKEPVKSEPLSLDRFILIKAIPSGINLLMAAISYGLIISFGAVFGKEIGVEKTGIFYTLLAVGIFISRFSTGKYLNKGYFKQIGITSLIILTFAYSSLAFTTAGWQYFSLAVFIGVGFGMLTPAFQTMTVNMAPHNKRGTANSTFFTSFDLGVGGGMFFGGKISELWDLNTAFGIVAVINLLALIIFLRLTIPIYQKNTLIA